MNKIFKVKCPQCETVFSYYESEFRPFCCERCKMIDLGHWFEETYRVPEKGINDNVNSKNEKTSNEEKNQQQIENENGYDDYTQIDEDAYDENDY